MPLGSPHQFAAYVGLTIGTLIVSALAAAQARAFGERERLLAELAVQRDRLTALMAIVHGEVWFSDADGHFMLASQSGTREFGLTAGMRSEIEIVSFAASLNVLRADGSARSGEANPLTRAQAGEVIRDETGIVRLPTSGEVRIRAVNAGPVRNANGEITGAVASVQDVTERMNAQEAIKQSEERLRLAVGAARMGMWEWNLDTGEMRWSNEQFLNLGYAPGSVAPSYEAWRARVVPEDLARVEGILRKSLETNTPYQSQHRVLGKDDAVRWVEAHGGVAQGIEGPRNRLFGVVLDITERKMAEEQTALLLKEVNHRAKNLLTVIQSMALLTAEDEKPDNFYKTFSARLVGLAASHDLLVRSEWHGVDLETLIRAQLAHLKDLIGSRILLTGSPVELAPSAAQAIGMAMHELATNAVKHGALSNAVGRVEITWDVQQDTAQAGAQLHLTWSERDGPVVGADHRQGFGHVVMVEMPEHLLQAKVSLSFEPSGVVWEFAAPIKTVTGNPPLMVTTAPPDNQR